jgi:hypothetical protein
MLPVMNTEQGNRRLSYLAFFKWMHANQNRRVREKAQKEFGVGERAIREALGVFVKAGWLEERTLSQRGAPKRYTFTAAGKDLLDAGMKMGARIDAARIKHGTAYTKGRRTTPDPAMTPPSSSAGRSRRFADLAAAHETRADSNADLTAEHWLTTEQVTRPCPLCTRNLKPTETDRCEECVNKAEVLEIIRIEREELDRRIERDRAERKASPAARMAHVRGVLSEKADEDAFRAEMEANIAALDADLAAERAPRSTRSPRPAVHDARA